MKFEDFSLSKEILKSISDMGFEEPTPIQVSAIPLNPFAIILEPTRELAVQVSEEINKIGRFKNVNVLPVYGGTSIERQIKALKRGVDIIVGTPGRIIDHLNRKTISLSDIKVEDLADKVIRSVDDIIMKGRRITLFASPINLSNNSHFF